MTGGMRFDRIADEYDQTRGGEDRGDRNAACLAPFLRPETPVLEVGVGTGVVALGLARRGFRVIGIDLSEQMARRAAARIGARVCVGDAASLPFPDDAFEQASSVWVLHVVTDVGAVLREVARVVRPDGSFVVLPAGGAPGTDEMGRLFAWMEAALRRGPDRFRAGQADGLRELAPATGWRLVEEHEFASSWEAWPYEEARRLEARSYTSLWDLDEERFEAVVRPVIEQLYAMPNEPVVRDTPTSIVVLRRER